MNPRSKIYQNIESFFEGGLLAAALVSVLVTLAIFYILISEALPFFQKVKWSRLFTDTEWTPLFEDPRFGILSLASGTFVTSTLALFIAVPIGLVLATYLAIFARPASREILKPILELLAGIPTVVYGYFALLLVTPILQIFLPQLEGFSMLSAGLVMGIMILPYMTSLSEDALNAVSPSLREGAFAMGATRWQLAYSVAWPTARSGLLAAALLSFARALGETMIVAIAAGMQPTRSLNPLDPAQTMTAFMVQVALGDLPHGSLGYQSLFVVGLSLSLMSFAFTMLSQKLVKKNV